MTTKVGSSVLSTTLTGLVSVSSTTFTGTTFNGTTFNGTTFAGNLNGTWTQMPSGTRVPFAQAAAPTGWTQDTTDNATNRMLRVVNTAGNGIGGSASPILNNTVPSHTHGFSTGGVSADHTHYDAGHTHPRGASFRTFNGYQGNFANGGIDLPDTGIGYASLSGVSANHTHSGGTDGGSSQTNWAPRYLANIMCYKS